MKKNNPAAAILIGGNSSRMGGIPKYTLRNEEGISFFELQMDMLSDFERIYISAARQSQLDEAMTLLDAEQAKKLIPVIDGEIGKGPLEGLYRILSEAAEEWIFVTACDMPMLKKELYRGLAAYLDKETDCVVCQDEHGKIHPMGAFYNKGLVPVIANMIAQKDYRMMNLLIRSRCRVVCLGEMGIDDTVLQNINTPEDLSLHRKKQKVLCICGVKNSGKTTYIHRLIERLTELGKTVAVIKHDGHDFEGDRPGTDSFHFHEAGASGTAVFSSERYMINHDIQVDAEYLMKQFPEADIILVEGLKQSSMPKIELIRSEISKEISCNQKNLLAIVTDCEDIETDTEQWSYKDIEQCAAYLMKNNDEEELIYSTECYKI